MQNSTAIKCMCKRLKPGPFSSSSSSGLGTRVTDDDLVKVFQQTFFMNSGCIYQLDKAHCRNIEQTGNSSWVVTCDHHHRVLCICNYVCTLPDFTTAFSLGMRPDKSQMHNYVSNLAENGPAMVGPARPVLAPMILYVNVNSIALIQRST